MNNRMGDTNVNYSGETIPFPFPEGVLANLCGDVETTRRFSDPIKSDYQSELEKNGWVLLGNEIATNYHIGLDLHTEPIKISLRRMKEDYETRICPGQRVGFFRAHNTSGERIPSVEMDDFFGKHVRIVAVYVRDLE
tara:strand:+ start:75127 stop:75537 length:411 start_codon:yes stop_codon:yes gene_type:complete